MTSQRARTFERGLQRNCQNEWKLGEFQAGKGGKERQMLLTVRGREDIFVLKHDMEEKR